MKKFILSLILFLGVFINTNAQIQWYRTTQYAYAQIYNNSYHWSDWQPSNINVCINLSNDRIIIYSPSIQVYQVYETANNGRAYTDNSGGSNIKFYVVDQDGDKGHVRLRIERNGNSQIYIDFSNVAWCYNVVRTS